MSDINSSPVTLPAGSYDHDTLKKGLDKAANGAAKNYDKAVATALEASAETVFSSRDPRTIPGYTFKEVENVLGGTETIQVYDPKQGEKIDDDTSGTVALVPTTPAASAEPTKE